MKISVAQIHPVAGNSAQTIDKVAELTRQAASQGSRLIDNRDQVLDPLTAYQMVSIMESVVNAGTATVVKSVGKPLAGVEIKIIDALLGQHFQAAAEVIRQVADQTTDEWQLLLRWCLGGPKAL